ncbi:hypothetical protein B0H14DRAFT_2584310 [Mycena olivaceomarginata]|nr:hypothetical protein B0H14DRAFT_2584310 [Mycena olivaceomarginata]
MCNIIESGMIYTVASILTVVFHSIKGTLIYPASAVQPARVRGSQLQQSSARKPRWQLMILCPEGLIVRELLFLPVSRRTPFTKSDAMSKGHRQVVGFCDGEWMPTST